jgi:hypothetical protein
MNPDGEASPISGPRTPALGFQDEKELTKALRMAAWISQKADQRIR